jgi:hypothetical protein
MSTYEYTEKISDNYLKIYVDANNIMWIHNYHVDELKGKLFAIMIKKACDNIIEKHNCKKHMQYITHESWEYLKNDLKWKVECDDDASGVKLISCDIINAPVCIIDGFMSM